MDKPDYKVRLKTFQVVKVAEGAASPEAPITGAGAATAYLLPFFKKEDAGREHFAALFLDGKHRPLAGKILFSGSSSEAAVYPREIARMALLIGASALLCCHNHPSGDLLPSAEDIALTRRLDEALRLIDIRLLDSIVLSVDDGRFASMRERGDYFTR